jgi:hypothetical protein
MEAWMVLLSALRRSGQPQATISQIVWEAQPVTGSNTISKPIRREEITLRHDAFL